MPATKPPDREISLDAYEQVVNGEVYHPHEGEALWLEPGDQVGDMLELGKMARYKLRVEAIKDDADAEVQAVPILQDLIDDFAAFLAPRLVRWSVTDRRGQPLPQPDGDPEKVKAIDKTLLMWVFGRLQVSETPARRGEG